MGAGLILGKMYIGLELKGGNVGTPVGMTIRIGDAVAEIMVGGGESRGTFVSDADGRSIVTGVDVMSTLIEGDGDSNSTGARVATGSNVGDAPIGTAPVGAIVTGKSAKGAKVAGTNTVGITVVGMLNDGLIVTGGLDSCGTEAGDEVTGAGSIGEKEIGIEESGTSVSDAPELSGDKLIGVDPAGTFVPDE